MVYELFKNISFDDEIRGMLLALGSDTYAVSDLDKNVIKAYAKKHGIKVSVRSRSRDNKVDVRLKVES